MTGTAACATVHADGYLAIVIDILAFLSWCVYLEGEADEQQQQIVCCWSEFDKRRALSGGP